MFLPENAISWAALRPYNETAREPTSPRPAASAVKGELRDMRASYCRRLKLARTMRRR